MPEIVMPRLSDTMEEGKVARWLKHPGDPVHRGDVLAEIETDKAMMDLEAYDEGVIGAVLVGEGESAPIGRPIATLETGAGGEETPRAADALPPVRETDGAVEAAPEPPAPEPPPPEPPPPEPPAPEPVPASARRSGGPSLVTMTSPLARALARRNGIDLETISGSGPGGRIVRADVEEAVARLTPGATMPTRVPQPSGGVAAPPRPGTAEDEVEKVPLSTVRRVTAERLTESAAVPHFSLTRAVDVEALLSLRAEVNGDRTADGERVSVTDLLVKACAKALRAHPEANAAWGGDTILRHRRVHVGVAVAVPDGLVVPVVHDADHLTLTDVAREAHRLEERARSGRLSVEDLGGGTFTLSNLGMFGVEHFTAVINPPQAAILAVGAATPEAVVRKDEIVIRTTMRVTLSVDHRVLDGATAAAFLADLVRLLEHPLGIVV